MSDDPKDFLDPGPMVDSTNPEIAAYAAVAVEGLATDKEKAICLYYKIRDEVRYDPYSAELSVEGMKASNILANRRGYCVAKAALLAAVCRAQGIPARLGFADVRNHLTTEKMRQRMKTDLFYWHGYTDIFIDGKWVKSTPAFNVELCEKFGLHPLEFDGEEDSIYHPFDTSGNRHMEYLNYRGAYFDVPLDEIRATFVEKYDHWKNGVREDAGDFDAEVAAETA